MTIQISPKIPFSKMTFAPDIPSSALGPNEYNAGANVESDVRGIRAQAGDQEILDTVPGTPTFITSGFRQNGQYWFVVCTTEGHWWASNGPAAQGYTTWYDITPNLGNFSNYTQSTNITGSWNGNVLLVNDENNPPMFWPDTPGAVLVMYSNQIPLSIANITNSSLTTRQITFSTATTITSVPFQTGGYIVVSGVNPSSYNGTFQVTTCTTSTVTYLNANIGPYAGDGSGTVSPAYTWNYNPAWKNVYAKWMRLYNTPNVGSILVAGNLVVTPVSTSTTVAYPVTVQWSQSFGLNQAPLTWTPTIANVANQLEVPLRGPALDGFPLNGNFYLCSYWDTVIFSPINYSTTSAPILGIRLFNQGRGLLSSNCWALSDNVVYGVDARDIWVFDGQNFTGIGNQRVKNWFYDQIDPAYYGQVFMQENTQKNQIEIYYPTRTAIGGVPNKMISYRFDIDCWNAPRDINSATLATESPLWVNGNPNFANRTVVYARGTANRKLIQKDQGFAFVGTNTGTITAISSVFQRDNIKILPNYVDKVMVHRVLPELNNLGTIIDQGNDLPIYSNSATVTLTVSGANSVGSTASAITSVSLNIDANGNNNANPWAQIDQNAFRVTSLKLASTSTSSVWFCSNLTYQYTAVEEDR